MSFTVAQRTLKSVPSLARTTPRYPTSLLPLLLTTTAAHTPSVTRILSSQLSAPPTRFFHTTRHNALPSGGMGGPVPTYFQKTTSLPMNTIIRFVPQQTAWIVERMGKFHRILQPGLAILIPFIDRIAYVKSLKEVAIEIPSQSAITADNVTLELDGVLYTRVFDAYKARFVPPPLPAPLPPN
jgi:hypothetical protein